MTDDKIRVLIRAYERDNAKTKLSQFTNDAGYVTEDKLADFFEDFKQWVLEHFAGTEGGAHYGNLYGGDVKYRDSESIRTSLNCRDVQDRVTANVRYYCFGGNVKGRLDGTTD